MFGCRSDAASTTANITYVAPTPMPSDKTDTAVNPGFTATDMNGHQGTQTVKEGAAEAVRLALLPDDGPTGGFTETGANNPW